MQAPAQQPVVADWAWISKNPGENEHKILAASRGDIDVTKIAWTHVAGVPRDDLPSGVPWGPPWVTFGTHGAGNRPLVSVSVQYPWDGLDQAGRPIWPRDFFACGYEDTARHDASYQTMYAAILQARVLKRTAEPLPLMIAPQSLDGDNGLIAAVQDKSFGFRPLAAIAAALLDGRQVAVAGAAMLPLGARLRLLDAVAALLPYGVRADLTVSSAIDSKVAHQIRLVLTEAPGDNQQVIDLNADRLPRPQSEPARRYLKMLLEKGDEENSGLSQVIGYLWQQKRPCPLSDPAEAVGILERLDRYRYALMGIRKADRAPLADAVAWLDGDPLDVRQRWLSEREYDPGMPGKVFTTLLQAEDPRASAALRTHWDTVFDDLVEFDNRQLNQGQIEMAERSLVIAGFAQRELRADNLLRRLLVPDGIPEPWQDPIRHRVSLLRRLTVPSPADFVNTCIALQYKDISHWQGAFVHALLCSEIPGGHSGGRVTRWASWLFKSAFVGDWPRPGWIAALRFAVGDPAESESAASVISVIDERPDWVVLILRLAGLFGRLGLVLNVEDLDLSLLGIALQQMTSEDCGGGFRSDLAAVLDVPLWDNSVDARTVGAIDIARVMLGRPPRDFPYSQLKMHFDGYRCGVERAFDALRDEPRRDHIQTSFLDHLTDVEAGKPGRLPAAVVQLLDTWIKDAAMGPDLARYIRERNMVERLLEDPLLGPDFWLWLIRHDPGFQPLEPVVQLHVAVRRAIESPETEFTRSTRELIDPSSGDKVTAVIPSGLARAMHNAWRSQRTAEQILAAIARVSLEDQTPQKPVNLVTRLPPLAFHGVLREFESLASNYFPAEAGVIDASARRGQAALAEMVWLECLHLVIHAHVLGEDYAREFQASFAGRSQEGKDVYRRLKLTFARRRGLRGARRVSHTRYEQWQEELRQQWQRGEPWAGSWAAEVRPQLAWDAATTSSQRPGVEPSAMLARQRPAIEAPTVPVTELPGIPADAGETQWRSRQDAPEPGHRRASRLSRFLARLKGSKDHRPDQADDEAKRGPQV